MCESPQELLRYFLNLASSPECQLTLSSVAFDGEVSFSEYLPLFLWTLGLEAAFYILALRGKKWWQGIVALVVCNLATHPAVVFLIPRFFARFELSQGLMLAFAETFAPVVEALLLIFVWRVERGRAITLMIAANLFSWGVGLWLLG